MKLTRRKFLETVVVSASAVAFGGVLSGCDSDKFDPRPAEEATKTTFPQSLMSGDPRPDSVILWTRVEGLAGVDTGLVLQVSLDAGFQNLVVNETLTALASHDHCLKARVVNLAADTTYYYRFLSGSVSTNIGRTKTAPAVDADRKAKFAFVSCQDYIGRYYNTYIRMLQDDMDDLDFIVHLGDYIYETSGDPSFQSSSSTRKVTFTGTGADAPLTIGSGDSAFEAAQTVHNYRELYKTYRSDEMLQKIHEKFPIVVIWDDHEFSDDSWQNNATYHGATTGEGSIDRKQNSEQVFFEYIPIDQANTGSQAAVLAQGRIDVDSSTLSQGSVTDGVGSISDGVEIYRSLRFGKHLDLYLTDYRTHRPDHLIAEDAFPGTVITPTSASVVPSVSSFVAFASLAAGATFVQLITGVYISAYEAQGNDTATATQLAAVKASEVMTGNLSHAYLTAVVDGAVAAGQLPSANGNALKADLDGNIAGEGLSYFTLGKSSVFSELGARYLVVKEAYDALAGLVVGVAGQNAYGVEQESWLKDGLANSDATWRVLGSSVSLTSMMLGLNSTGVAASSAALAGGPLDNDFYLNVDQWDGFTTYRAAELIPALEKTANSPNGAISIAGDIHSSWVSKHGAVSDIYSFTCPSISSGTFKSFIADQADTLVDSLKAGKSESDQAALDTAKNSLVAVLDNIVLQSSKLQSDADKVSKGEIEYNRMDIHGFGVAEVDADGFVVTFHQMSPEQGGLDLVGTSYYNRQQTVLDAFYEAGFRVENGALVRMA